MSAYRQRTDLALESAETIRKDRPLPQGVEFKERRGECFDVTEINVTTDDAARRIEKPKGRYITIEARSRLDMKPENFGEWSKELSLEIMSLLGRPESALVVGLGNRDITPDSLGPRVSDHIFATRHIKTNAPELYSDDLGDVSSLATGVMGQTGIEASELVKTVAGNISPSVVLAVDALACSEVSHLGTTIQLTDTGISPGSGVLNSRRELSKSTLGVPCVAIGVPTICDLGSLSPSSAGDGQMMVTPRSIDKLISCSAQLISAAINLSLHPGLDLEEILCLTS